jgi:hypothetical protein
VLLAIVPRRPALHVRPGQSGQHGQHEAPVVANPQTVDR